MAKSKSKTESKDKVFEAIVAGYREVIDQRYTFKNLKAKYQLPKSIDETIVDEIKYFFLNYIYPDIEKREELNAAFETLDDNLRNPQKLLGVISESVKLLFKHGRHLPKILNAGFKALKSFKAASNFENTLIDRAISKKENPPYDTHKINELIASLSREDIENFIDSTESLFQIMYDKILVKKIIEVIGYLIERMKKKPKLFSAQEIRGLETGLEMISKGDAVLNSLTKKNQDILIQFIVKVEKDNLNDLFS